MEVESGPGPRKNFLRKNQRITDVTNPKLRTVSVSISAALLVTLLINVMFSPSSSSSSSILPSLSTLGREEARNYNSLTYLYHKYWLNQPVDDMLEQSVLHLKNLLHVMCTNSAFLDKIEYKQKILPAGRFNYIEIKNEVKSANPRTLVLMHGYASGVGFFYNNLEQFSKKFDRVIAIDWLGFGASSRYSKGNHVCPKRSIFSDIIDNLLPTSNILPKHNPKDTTDFFVNGLHQFIEDDEELGTAENKFYIAGHSLGGYLTARYTLKHPEKIERLIMISPVGIEKIPDSLNILQLPWGVNLVRLLWSVNFTPQSILRLLPEQRGKKMVETSMHRRFGGRFEPAQLEAISNYLYYISSAPAANAEYALNSIMIPIASKKQPTDPAVLATITNERQRAAMGRNYRLSIHAREPLYDDFARIKSIPIYVAYGDDDWLSYDKVSDDIKALQDSGVNISLTTIKNAGHHLYLDNTQMFHDTINEWLEK